MNFMVRLSYMILVAVLMTQTDVSFAYDKDPVKSTQSDTVAVTDELLDREGQLGPASPTIKIPLITHFFSKTPFLNAEEEDESAAGEGDAPWWESWFQWMGDKTPQP
jgi:hypothetical protein